MKGIDYMLLVECKPDRTLAISLSSISLKKVEHAGNKAGVLKKLTENYENSIGIIDEDPSSTQPPDLRKFTEIEYLESKDIRILHHERLNNRLLILCPRLEEWIVKAAREAQIGLRDYHLPDNPVALHETINISIDRFEELLRELVQRSSRVKELQRLLRTSARRRSPR